MPYSPTPKIKEEIKALIREITVAEKSKDNKKRETKETNRR